MARILFTNVKVLDGSGAEPFPAKVLVEGNRIKSVTPVSEVLSAEGAPPVDGGGAPLMPGLVEAPSHITFANTAALPSLCDIPPEEDTLPAPKAAKAKLAPALTSINSC